MHHDASGSRYAGSTHDVASRTPPSGIASNASGGASTIVVRRPCTFPAATRASNSEGATTHCMSGPGTATSASRGAVSSAKPPPPSGTDAATCCGPPSNTARAEAPAKSRASCGRPSIASYTVCHPVHRQRCAANALSRSPRVPAARMMMPGVQKPHCDPPVAANAAANSDAPSSPSIVVTDRPATRWAGVTHATRGAPSTSTVQHPHWPWGAQPSFAPTSPSRSRSTESSDSPGSTSTSTSAPLQTNATRSLTPTSGAAG